MLPTRRISLECPVIGAEALQQWVSSFTQGMATDLMSYDDYHLTVLHLGKTDEIFETVRAHTGGHRNSLSEERFLTQFRAWLRVHVKTLRHPVEIGVTRLATLRQQAPYALVCRATTLPPQLRDLHENLLSSFGSFLEKDLGVPDGLAFVRTSPTFGFSGGGWIPHVTVGTVGIPVDLALPPYDIRLAPLKVRNGESVGVYGSELL